MRYILVSTSLIAVSEAPHTAHHAENIVVGGEHVHLGAGVEANSVVGDSQQQSGVIDTG